MAAELNPTRENIASLGALRNKHARELSSHDVRFGDALRASQASLWDGPEAWYRAACDYAGIHIFGEEDLRPLYDKMSELTAMRERQRGHAKVGAA
jgi:hypothetical protein